MSLLVYRKPFTHNTHESHRVVLMAVVDELTTRYTELVAARDTVSKSRYEQKRLDFKDPLARERGAVLKRTIHEAEQTAHNAERELWCLARQIPNDTHPDVPIGAEENARIVRVCGEPRQFDFACEDHIAIAARLGM